MGDKITKTLEERERLIKKLKDAEFEYNAILTQANAKKELILADALEKQRTILLEWELLNTKLTKEIVEDATRKADTIIQNASTETKRIQDELTKNREDAVKTTTKSVVKKLLHEEKDLQDAYLKTLIDDVHTK